MTPRTCETDSSSPCPSSRTAWCSALESGLRSDANGNLRPRHIISRFEARFGLHPLFTWEPGVSVSPNPYIEFTFRPRESGELLMVWTDEKGPPIEARRAITVP